MGYSETYCHICAVSFHIGRIRRPDEPRSAAFDSYACPYVRESDDADCPLDSGCQVVNRAVSGQKCAWTEKRELVSVELDENSQEELDDSDFVPEESNDGESLEYDSEAVDSGDEGSSLMSVDPLNVEEGNYIKEFWQRAYQRYDQAMIPHSYDLSTWHQRDYGSRHVEDVFHPRFRDAGEESTEQDHEGESEDTDEEPLIADLLTQRLEHIAGQGCANYHGYNGHNISVEEMVGCRTLQCLVRKTIFEEFNGQAEIDDELFEREGDFFLSGLSDHVPTKFDLYDLCWPKVSPARHGVRDPDPENIYCFDDPSKCTMTFHPWCLEVYKRTAHIRSGDVDISGLTSWFSRNISINGTSHLFKRHPDLYASLEQVWQHRPGMEYLSANPLFVPNLAMILESTISTDPNFDSRKGAFDVDINESSHENGHDPFDSLSMELKLMILDQLDSKDIANVRLVSRSFRQLPISLWHHLILREMPWLWEAWSTLPYSCWATTTGTELKAIEEKHILERLARSQYNGIIEEEMPELFDALEDACQRSEDDERQEVAQLRRNCKAPVSVPNTLPRDRTN